MEARCESPVRHQDKRRKSRQVRASGAPFSGGRGVGPRLFTTADASKDGSLTREELKTTFDKWFSEWDSAKSGLLTREQLVAGLNAALPLPARSVTYTPEEYTRIAAAAKADSTPGFAVRIDRPYYIGKYEVTQTQWKKVMGGNPSVFQGDKVADDADKHPVENVTWDDAQAFIQKLSAMEKTTAYRLPTEFEWEYAARGGAEDNEKIFPDPIPPRTGKQHILKGGGFVADVKNATYMTHAAGPGSKGDVGFRLVCDVK